MPKRAKRANSTTTAQKSMLVIVLCVIVQVLAPYRHAPCVPYAFLLIAVEFSSDAVYLKVLRWGRKAEKEILGLECPVGFAHLDRSVTIVVRGCNYPLASAKFCDSHRSSSLINLEKSRYIECIALTKSVCSVAVSFSQDVFLFPSLKVAPKLCPSRNSVMLFRAIIIPP